MGEAVTKTTFGGLIQPSKEVKSVRLWHMDIEKHRIGLFALDNLHTGFDTVSLAGPLQAGVALDKGFQQTAAQELVIDDNHFDNAVGHSPPSKQKRANVKA